MEGNNLSESESITLPYRFIQVKELAAVEVKCATSDTSECFDELEAPSNVYNLYELDDYGFACIPNTPVSSRAVATLPKLLTLKSDSIYCTVTLPSHIRFGPVQGIRRTITSTEAKHILNRFESEATFLIKDDSNNIQHIDVSDEDKSNWVHYLKLCKKCSGLGKCVPSCSQLYLRRNSNELYMYTQCEINPGTQLTLAFDNDYINEFLDVHDKTKSSPKFVCNICSKIFTKDISLTKHLKCHKISKNVSNKPLNNKFNCINDVNKKYLCQDCNKTFRNKKILATHWKSKHTNIKISDRRCRQIYNKKYQCVTCCIKFKRRGMYVNHMMRCHNEPVNQPHATKLIREYNCTQCHKSYKSNSKRNRHMMVHHPGIELPRGFKTIVHSTPIKVNTDVHSCIACHRQYVSNAKLLKHVRSHHSTLAHVLLPKLMKRTHKNIKCEQTKNTLNTEVIIQTMTPNVAANQPVQASSIMSYTERDLQNELSRSLFNDDNYINQYFVEEAVKCLSNMKKEYSNSQNYTQN